MIILGIETSCDDTALALIETRTEGGIFETRVIGSLVHSQADLHSQYGGVFPTLAKREHGKNLVPLLHRLLSDCQADIASNDELSREAFDAALEPFIKGLTQQNPDLFESLTHADFLKQIPKIDRIAVTEGPGLEPTLWVGIMFARILGALWKIPIIPVNHMEGHIVGSLLASDAPHGSWQRLKDLPMPAITLLISGGHTQLVLVPRLGSYEIVGETKDDAVGEAFDKVARLIGLPYPGGPHISKLADQAAAEHIESPVTLPRPMIASKDEDFSFSGLKTAVLYAVRDAADKETGALSDSFKKGLALEFETAVAETLSVKLKHAIDKHAAGSIIIGGGVSANRMLRERFAHIAEEYGIPLYMPSAHISGDNALMIALAGALDARPHATEPTAQGTKRLGT